MTHNGAEFYKVSTKRGECKLSRALKYTTHTWWYAAEQRLLLLGTGNIGNEMRSWFLRSEASDMPKLELPPPEKVPKFVLEVSPRPQDIALACIYDDMYCTQIDSSNSVVRLFLITKDGALHTHSLNLCIKGEEFQLSVVDNLLAVHATDSNISMLYDLHYEAGVRPGSTGPDYAGRRREGREATPPMVLDPIAGGSTVMFSPLDSRGIAVAADGPLPSRPQHQLAAVDDVSRSPNSTTFAGVKLSKKPGRDAQGQVGSTSCNPRSVPIVYHTVYTAT